MKLFPSITLPSALRSTAGSIQPARDWLLLLTLFAIGLLASVAWNLWQFSHITRGEAIGNEVATPPTHEINIAGVRALFDARSTERSKYLHDYRFVDPSL